MPDLTQPWPFGLHSRNWPLYLLGLVLVLAIAVWGDAAISQAAQRWPGAVIGAFNGVTQLGRSEWVLLPLFGLGVLTWLLSIAIAKATPRRALSQMTGLYAFFLTAVGLPGLIGAIVKRMIGRARPTLFAEQGWFSFHPNLLDWRFQSFPSGHSTTIFAMAYAVSFLSPRWFWPSIAIALAVMISRIPLGAHYPTDVLGGAVLGILGAYAARSWFAGRSWVFRRLPDGRIVPRRLVAVERLSRPRRQPSPR